MTLVVVILCFALAWNWARKRWYWNKYQELLFAKDRIADSMEDPSHSGETGVVKALRAGWPVMVFAPDFTRFVGRNFPCQITWMKIDGEDGVLWESPPVEEFLEPEDLINMSGVGEA